MKKNKSRKIIIFAKCEGCNSKKSKLIKKQEAIELLSQLGIRTPLSKIPLLGNILLLTGDMFMLQMQLRHPGCGPFTKKKTKAQKVKEQFVIYKSE